MMALKMMTSSMLLSLMLVAAVVGQAPPNEEEDLQPPKITYPLAESSEYVKIRDKYTLKCQAKSAPMDPVYSWFKILGAGKMDQVKPSGSINLDSMSGDLTFLSFQDDHDSDEGKYMCMASIFYGNPSKQAATFAPVQEVLIRSLEPFKDTTAKSAGDKEYKYLQLPCYGRGDSKGDNPLSWYNQPLVAGNSDTQIEPESDPRLFLDKSGTLHFTYLKREDASSVKGKYQCSEGDEQTIYKGGEITLNVEPVPSATASKPALQYSSGKQFVRQFTQAHLECVFQGYDPANVNHHLPVITWKDHSFQTIVNDDKYTISEDGRQLFIDRVTAKDTGSYHCEATNNGGTNGPHPIEVQVVDKPVWESRDSRPVDVTSPEKKDVVVECKAKSLQGQDPPKSPIWYVDGAKFKPENFQDKNGAARKFSTRAQGKELVVHNLNKDTDVMCIQCVVENDVGQTWGDGCITVIEPIEPVMIPDTLQEIEHGDIVNLTVLVQTDPMYTDKLKYEWEFRNSTTTGAPNQFTIYNATSHEAYINTSALTQEEYNEIGGVYTRRIYHQFDEYKISITVKITDPKPVAVIQSAGFDMWILGLIVGILFLIVVIIIIVFIICRKQQEGDYNVDKKETGAGLDPEKELKSKHFDDYSRPEDYADYSTYSDHKPRGDLEYDDVPIGGDDESLGEYGGEETYFNEDGSFIGIYDEKKAKKYRHNNGYSNESAI